MIPGLSTAVFRARFGGAHRDGRTTAAGSGPLDGATGAWSRGDGGRADGTGPGAETVAPVDRGPLLGGPLWSAPRPARAPGR